MAFSPEDFCFWKYSLIYTIYIIYTFISFLSIQLLKQLLQPFCVTCSLSLFFFITSPTFNSFWLVFFAIFFVKYFSNSSMLRSLIKNDHGTVFLTFLIKKISSDQFGRVLLHYVSKGGTFFIIFFNKLIYLIDFGSTSFILNVLWYGSLYLLTLLSNLSINTFLLRFEQISMLLFCNHDFGLRLDSSKIFIEKH